MFFVWGLWNRGDGLLQAVPFGGGSPPASVGFPSQRASDAKVLCFLSCYTEQAEEQLSGCQVSTQPMRDSVNLQPCLIGWAQT